MIRLLIIGAIAFVVYKLIAGGKKKHKPYSNERREKEVGDMVQDPICGTYVSINSDIRVKEGNKVYFFCSYECRDKFLKQKGYDQQK